MSFFLLVTAWITIAAAIALAVFVISSSIIAAGIVAVVVLWIELRLFLYYF